MTNELLTCSVQRCQEGHVLGRLYRRDVVINRLMGDAQFHAAPRLWLAMPLWVK